MMPDVSSCFFVDVAEDDIGRLEDSGEVPGLNLLRSFCQTIPWSSRLVVLRGQSELVYFKIVSKAELSKLGFQPENYKLEILFAAAAARRLVNFQLCHQLVKDIYAWLENN